MNSTMRNAAEAIVKTSVERELREAVADVLSRANALCIEFGIPTEGKEIAEIRGLFLASFGGLSPGYSPDAVAFGRACLGGLIERLTDRFYSQCAEDERLSGYYGEH